MYEHTPMNVAGITRIAMSADQKGAGTISLDVWTFVHSTCLPFTATSDMQSGCLVLAREVWIRDKTASTKSTAAHRE
jgi:hypothetical protein